MTPEEIKTLIEQEAELWCRTNWMEGLKPAYLAAITFYEQTILPQIIKGWKDNVEAWETAAAGAGINHVVEYHQKRIRELEDELSQLQSSMEEEKRKVKEDLIWQMIKDWQDARSIDEDLDVPKFSFSDIEHELYQYFYTSTPSTEGK